MSIVFLKIDESVIEDDEDLAHFDDNAAHQISTVFHFDNIYKTHLHTGNIRIVGKFVVIDIEDSTFNWAVDSENPIPSARPYGYKSYVHRAPAQMTLHI